MDLPAQPSAQTLLVLVPVFNDWESVGLLLPLLDAELGALDLSVRVLLVDDGSTQAPPPALSALPLEHVARVERLRLRRNLGHQRAIAIALAYAEAELACDWLVIMDSDGEDRPEDVPRLVREARAREGVQVVFAERTRRSGRPLFRLGYHAYRALHKALTGISVRVGNFSALSREVLPRLVVVSELWNHYAASVFQSRIPYTMIPTSRGRRLVGESKMSFVGHVLHGLRALSVHGELVGVRLLIGSAAALGLTALLGLAALARLAQLHQEPGLLPGGLFLLGLFLLLQTVFLSGTLALLFLQQRTHASFLPTRDYVHYVEATTSLWERGGADSAASP